MSSLLEAILNGPALATLLALALAATFFVYGVRAPLAIATDAWKAVAIWALVDFLFGFELETAFGTLLTPAAESDNQLLLERTAVVALLWLTLNWLGRYAHYSEIYLAVEKKMKEAKTRQQRYDKYHKQGYVGSFDLAEPDEFDDSPTDPRIRQLIE